MKVLRTPKESLGSVPGLTGKRPLPLTPGSPFCPSQTSLLQSHTQDTSVAVGPGSGSVLGPALLVEGMQASTRVIRTGGLPEDSD